MDFTRFKKTQKKVLRLIENSYKKNTIFQVFLLLILTNMCKFVKQNEISTMQEKIYTKK